MSNLESDKITKLVYLFAEKVGINDPKRIQVTIEDLQRLNIDDAIDKILISLSDLIARKVLTEDDVLEYKDDLISLNPQRYPSFSDLRERLYYLKEMNIEHPQLSLEENHQLVIEVFDKFNQLIGTDFDCYYTGGLMGYLATSHDLERYHSDLDLFINEEQLLKLKELIDKNPDFSFISNMDHKQDMGHEYKITFKDTSMSIGLFLFSRKEDNSITTKQYYFDSTNNHRQLFVDEQQYSKECSDFMFVDDLRYHNGTPYRMLSLESIYNEKKNSRPKDRYDAEIIEPFIDKNIEQKIAQERKKTIVTKHTPVDKSIINRIEQNDITIDELEDRSIYFKKLTNDNIINITGEGGSGKSSLADEYRKDERYIVIDYDLIVGTPQEGTIEFELRQMLLDKYGVSLFQNLRNSNIDQIKENFTKIYQSIISYFSSSEKTIVLDGTQLRFIEDASLIKGEVIVLRPSLKTCLNRSVARFKNEHPNATRDEVEAYKNRRNQILHRLNPLLNNLLTRIEQLPDVRDYKAEFDVTQIEQVLLQKQEQYLDIIKNEYGSFMNLEAQTLLEKIAQDKTFIIEKNGKEYLQNQQDDINSLTSKSDFEKIEMMRELEIPLAHGGRVFADNRIHFYPFTYLKKNPVSSSMELAEICDKVFMHELLHFFIRPQVKADNRYGNLEDISSFTTEGLVDMCTRDLIEKYQFISSYDSEYGSNVIVMREALSHIADYDERMKLVFNGSMADICHYTSTPSYDTYQELFQARGKSTEFDAVISDIAHIFFGNSKHRESVRRYLYNTAANYPDKEASLNSIDEEAQRRFSDKYPEINARINSYRRKNERIPFAKRKDAEIEIAQNIRVKNNVIAQQQNLNNSESITKKSGHINVITIALLISFVAGMISMIVYFSLK